ncbi:MAG: isoprenyl transferase [Candidatus Omnitrophica bacterium]|nr:isoprenyl transferase [Candidatus Omnitrophota bacterium]
MENRCESFIKAGSEEESILDKIDEKKLPKHVAVIMDGNGRWAKQRNLDRISGHKEGAKSARLIAECSAKIGIKHLTLFVFSSENWKRPKKEVTALMKYLDEYLTKKLKDFHDKDIRLLAIGELAMLPDKVQKSLYKAIEETKNNSKLTLILALSYGGRAEIVSAAKRIAKDVKNKSIRLEAINEELFSTYLYTAGIPDPDILIRTSYELRLSNFLLWQVSYTELYFSKKLWPDFNKKDLAGIIENYKKRERRFGKV